MAAVRVPPSAWSTSQSIRDLALAEAGEIDHGAQAAADQALDFLGAAALLAAGGLAVGAGMGGARQHAVFRRDPALAGIAQEGRHPLLHRSGAEHMGVAELGQARAFGVDGHAGFEHDRAQLVRGAAGSSHEGLSIQGGRPL